MLYIVHADGTRAELPEVASAHMDEDADELVCLSEQGEEIYRYPRLAILAFSTEPFPEGRITSF